jgi:hypothetical protein
MKNSTSTNSGSVINHAGDGAGAVPNQDREQRRETAGAAADPTTQKNIVMGGMRNALDGVRLPARVDVRFIPKATQFAAQHRSAASCQLKK